MSKTFISTFCSADKPQCIEIEPSSEGGVTIRNTDNSRYYVFATWDEWDAFLAGVKNGDFDRMKSSLTFPTP